jgi:hypothetical protein
MQIAPTQSNCRRFSTTRRWSRPILRTTWRAPFGHVEAEPLQAHQHPRRRKHVSNHRDHLGLGREDFAQSGNVAVVVLVGLRPVEALQGSLVGDQPGALLGPQPGAGLRLVHTVTGLADLHVAPRVAGARRLYRPLHQRQPHAEQRRHEIVTRREAELGLVVDRFDGPAEQSGLDAVVDVILQGGHAVGLALAEDGFLEVLEIGHAGTPQGGHRRRPS